MFSRSVTSSASTPASVRSPRSAPRRRPWVSGTGSTLVAAGPDVRRVPSPGKRLASRPPTLRRMSAWVIRGLGMAVLHGAAITLLAKYAVYHPTEQTPVVALALAVLVGAAALWSAVDAWRGLPDRGRVWFISALIAGP